MIKAVCLGTLSNLTTSVPEQSKDVSRKQVPDNSSRKYSKWECKTRMFLLTQCRDKEVLKHLLGKTGKVFQDVCSCPLVNCMVTTMYNIQKKTSMSTSYNVLHTSEFNKLILSNCSRRAEIEFEKRILLNFRMKLPHTN